MKDILLVDDDPIILTMVAANLRAAGYRVSTAKDGIEAVQHLRDHRTGIVISDWSMPRMDGLQLCEEVRRRSADGYIYFILLTTHQKASERVRGLASGADDLLNKPFDPRELLERVRIAERILQLETREALIFAMAKLAESRDEDTGQHLERVQRYSHVLCRELAIDSQYSEQVTPEFMRLVYQTCPLHDIGKVGIPDAILQKPGRLTPEEFEIMKRHVTIGADAIRATLEHSPSASFLQFALDIAQSHHEKFDGTGYPHGLKGNQIPLAARIVALADVYDALTTKRVYKDAFPHSKADAIIASGSGQHFDPVIVQAYRKAEVDFDTIRITLADNEPKAPLGLPPGQAIGCAPIAAPWPGNLPAITSATTIY